ncbi:3-oxoacyl-[acyl-carrier-protein] reductase FabG [Mycovorax composti]|uniref:3-oxoacyl-[acyl-carrier-protein] reductase FabG n=2 Tax=Chitinophagaceae TaxID=563835 RepID=A0ABZ2EKX5_9BACT
METKNKVALVTGGSRGIGRDIALRLADKGLDVIITYHTQAQAAEDVLQLIQSKGVKGAIFQLDTGNTKSFDALVENLKSYLDKEGYQQLDFLINNAGTALYGRVEEVSEEQLDAAYNIHFKGVYFLTQKVLPLMNNGSGIVNISSGLTRTTFPGSSAYASLKTAVETFTRYLAKELGERRIRANVVAPGAIETDFGGGRTRDNKEINAHIAAVTALGRAGLPTDIGGVVAFLCSDDAYWINGQRIEVSGGLAL